MNAQCLGDDTDAESGIVAAFHRGDARLLISYVTHFSGDGPTNKDRQDAVVEMIDAFFYMGSQHPAEIGKAARTIYIASQSPEFAQDLGFLVRCLREALIFAPFEGLRRLVRIEQQNPFLYSALVSGACARTGLSASDKHATMIAQGLQIPGSGWEQEINQLEREVYAIRACLALLASGIRVHDNLQSEVKELHKLLDKLGPALRNLADKGVIKNENGKRLLQLTTEQADACFSENLDFSVIWEALFPGSIVWESEEGDDSDGMFEEADDEVYPPTNNIGQHNLKRS